MNIDPMVWALSSAHPKLRPQWLRDRMVPAVVTTRKRGLVEVIKETERAINKPSPPEPLKIISAKARTQKANCKRIADYVCAYYGVSANAFYSIRRHVLFWKARHVAYYLARELTCASIAEIGRNFGDRDHTTIMNGCSRIERLLQTDRQLAADIAYITKALTPTQEAEAA